MRPPGTKGSEANRSAGFQLARSDDGFGASDQQSFYSKSVPVLFLTAKTSAAEQTRLAELSVAGILTKPFDPLKLAADVAAALRWS